jgi:hypothetical protein
MNHKKILLHHYGVTHGFVNAWESADNFLKYSFAHFQYIVFSFEILIR